MGSKIEVDEVIRQMAPGFRITVSVENGTLSRLTVPSLRIA